jgi:dihydroxy-acid dehydratase
MTKGLRKGLTSYGDAEFSLFLRKAFIKAMGYSDDALARPIIGITNTYSDYNPCHGNVPDLIESVKRGVMLAGGLPMVFPTISIHESFAYPTSMFLRNLMAMDTEEMVRAQPMDAVVVIGGCDKNLPAQVMAISSVDLPAIVLPTGPMLVGHHRGEVLGACTDCRRMWAHHRAGKIDEAEIDLISGRLVPTVGTCGVMGTASTMACIVEALGLSLPMSATAPATHADRRRIAEATGKRAAEMADSCSPKPSDLITPASVRNAMIVLQDWWIDEWADSPDSHGGARGRKTRSGNLRSAGTRDPCADQSKAVRHALHGGVSLRRRPACSHARTDCPT